MDLEFNARQSGEKKKINGYECHEVVVTVTSHEKGKTVEQAGGIILTSHVWLTPKIDTMKEIEDFNRRYTQKLAAPNYVPSVAPSTSGNSKYLLPAMHRLQTETSKLEGTAVLTETTTEFFEDAQTSAKLKKESGQTGTALVRGAVMTLKRELVKISTDVPDSDLDIPPGFVEK